MDPKWRQVNLVCSLDGDDVRLERKPLPTMRPELIELFDRAELSKYMTEEELADFDAAAAASGSVAATSGKDGV
jgi:succinate dehydrogenase / fumarate reductase flavoprotein subunit